MFDPKESPADIIKRIREERANRSYYQDQGIRIDPLVIYKNAANKEKDIGPDPKTSLVPKVDPINYLRDIAGQITVNRAKEAGLDVPGTLAEAFPERSKVTVPSPEPEPQPKPEPEVVRESAPESAPKMQRITIGGVSISKGKAKQLKGRPGYRFAEGFQGIDDHDIYTAANEAGIYDIKDEEDVRKVREAMGLSGSKPNFRELFEKRFQ